MMSFFYTLAIVLALAYVIGYYVWVPHSAASWAFATIRCRARNRWCQTYEITYRLPDSLAEKTVVMDRYELIRLGRKRCEFPWGARLGEWNTTIQLYLGDDSPPY